MDFWQTEYTESMKNMFLIIYPVLRSLEAKCGLWGVMELSPNVRKSPKRGICLPTTESELEGFLANRVHRIHGEHVLDVISSTGVAGCKGW